MRQYAREKAGQDAFVEVYVKADVQTCARRDPKGLYQKAFKGEINDFTGVSSPYQEPEHPEIILDTTQYSVLDCVAILKEYLYSHSF